MITYRVGDVLAVKRGILVHGCNATTNIAGGIAGVIFDRYPSALLAHTTLVHQYEAYHSTEALMGEISLTNPLDDLIIVNGITQRHPGAGTLCYDSMRDVFLAVGKIHYATALPIIMPKIGAGIAGGGWDIIQEIIEETIGQTNAVTVYTLSPIIIHQ